MAVAATAATAEAGQPVEAPGAAAGDAIQARDRQAVLASSSAAKTLLVKELVTLMAVSVAARLISRHRKKLEGDMKASPRAIRRR